MINSIKQISKLLNNAANFQTSFNAALPMSIKVLAKLKGDLYLLQVGNQQIKTKSNKELLVGQKYWGEMNKSSLGHIMLQNLISKPVMLDSIQNSPLQFSLNDLETLSKESNKGILDEFREFVIQKLAIAESKSEFIFLSNMLLALKSGILHLVIGDRDSILQIKAQGKNNIKFSAIMPMLGIIEGVILQDNSKHLLDLKVLYEKTKEILLNNAYMLDSLHLRTICLDKSISPLYEFKQQLLDIKG